MTKINITYVPADFSGDSKPADDTLAELLILARSGQIKCTDAVIPIKNIQPFSDFVPENSSRYRKQFDKALGAEKPPKLFVYESSGVFIMSDDYAAFHLYREKGYKSLPCVIIGVHSDSHVSEYLSEPYYLRSKRKSLL